MFRSKKLLGFAGQFMGEVGGGEAGHTHGNEAPVNHAITVPQRERVPLQQDKG